MSDGNEIRDEIKGDVWEWEPCSEDDDCIVIHRVMKTVSGMRCQPEDLDLHIPRRCLEAIVEQIQESDHD